MKKIIISNIITGAIITVFLLVGIIMGGCNQSPSPTEINEENQRNADWIINNIEYIRDPRTGLCFAYYWGGGGNGGPALSLVPSNSIPSNLIFTAQIPDSVQ